MSGSSSRPYALPAGARPPRLPFDYSDAANAPLLLRHFHPVLRQLSSPLQLTADVVGQLVLGVDTRSDTHVLYMPVGPLNTAARVVLVGLTPGPTQLVAALEAACAALRVGVEAHQVLGAARGAAAFRGMRDRLSQALTFLGLTDHFGVSPGSSAFDDLADRLQTTSAVRFPAFAKGRPYDGNPIKIELLRRFVEEGLGQELQTLDQALVLPLGRNAGAAVEHLIRTRAIDPGRCLPGLPHPSPANGHYQRLWLEHRERLRSQAQGWLGARPA